jgi:hypothetical protein
MVSQNISILAGHIDAAGRVAGDRKINWEQRHSGHA